MHEDLIRQLDEAVTEVFAIMLNLSCTSEPAVTAPELTPTGSFTASVWFSGPLEGRCCLHLEERTATELTSNMTGMPPSEISTDLCADTAGELCNMIAGCWKKRHPSEIAASLLSCPIVQIGSCNHAIDTFREDVTVLYRFDGHCVTLRLAFN